MNDDQLCLFVPGPPCQAHSLTSIVAAEVIDPVTGNLRLKVLGHFAKCADRGATDDEVQVALGMNPSTERPRRIELLRLGWIHDSGQTRLTRSGRKAVVWKCKSL